MELSKYITKNKSNIDNKQIKIQSYKEILENKGSRCQCKKNAEANKQ